MQSKDRVRFKLKEYYFTHGTTHALLHDAFGIYGPAFQDAKRQAKRYGHVEIICRPSQFARFIILREKHGFQNMFKELEADLFVPAEVIKQEPIDTSSNPANRSTDIGN